MATFSGHTKAVTCVAFSPDSRKVVSGGDDKTLIEWNATNAKQIAQWTKHKAPITDVAYSTDGKRLALLFPFSFPVPFPFPSPFTTVLCFLAIPISSFFQDFFFLYLFLSFSLFLSSSFLTFLFLSFKASS